MPNDQITIALKEWSVVQKSLLEQHQIILVRKGGIAEESGDFDLRSDQFAILPTYLHEDERRGDLQPCFEQWLREDNLVRPPLGTIRLRCICEVTEVVRIEDREKLFHLMPQHIWSKQFIDGRFEWEPYKPVFVLIVRAYQLPQPVDIPNLREYSGCRSWVTLAQPITTIGARPAIASDLHFERRRQLTVQCLR